MEDFNKTFSQNFNEEEVEPSQSENTIADAVEERPPENRFVDITAMIRSLQRSEGSNDCFRRGICDCDQLDCSWRQYCLSSKE
jgi:hypothetical protein